MAEIEYKPVPEKVNEELYDVVREGITKEEVIKRYSEWAPTFEKDLLAIKYNPPKFGAESLSELYPEAVRGNLRVLDCAAGTGLVGLELCKHGFTRLDALDACPEMCEECKKKNIYGRVICDFMGPNKLDIEDNTYDAVVSVGCFCEGHVKDDCFEELIRIVKPGGHIVIAMRQKWLQIVTVLKDNLEPTMQRHHDNGLWKWLSRKVRPNYHDEDEGIIYVFQVL